MRSSSPAGAAASKIAPQVAGAARQIFVPAKLFVQGKRHETALLCVNGYFTRRRVASTAAAVIASESQAAASPIRL